MSRRAGGRLDYVDDRAVATLVYQRHEHIINLIVWPTTGHGDSATQTLMRQGYNLAHWTRGGMTYWAVSDLNAGELQTFARLLQP